jgi:ketosteroid isomerase-like protein
MMSNTDQSIRDQLEIRTLIENYADAACRRDTAGIVACLSDDCHWSVPGMKGLENLRGTKQVAETWEAAKAVFPFCFLVCVPGYLDINGDTATARVYTTEILKSPDGTVRNAAGRYDDRLQRLNGKWLFIERIWTMMHQQISSG